MTMPRQNKPVPTHPMLGHRDLNEGSFTPSIGDDGLDGSGEAQGYTTQVGRFQRVGSWCHFQIDLLIADLGTMTGANVCRLLGLPFTARNTAGFNVPCVVDSASLALASAADSVVGVILPNTTRMEFGIYTLATGSSSRMTITELSAGADLKISGSYEIEPGQ